MCQKFLCSPKLIACSQFWNKGLFEIKIHDLGSGHSHYHFIYWGVCCSLWSCVSVHVSSRKQENQFSMSFLPSLRQLKLTPPVQDNWLFQVKNWHREALHFTRGCEVTISLEMKTHQATEQKLEAAWLLCPVMRQFPGMEQLWHQVLPRSIEVLLQSACHSSGKASMGFPKPAPSTRLSLFLWTACASSQQCDASGLWPVGWQK